MPTKPLSRRTVLRGVLAGGAGVTIPLPVLDIMLNSNGTAFAQGAPMNRRYCTWFFGNGILPPLWNPASTAVDWQLSQELAPLAKVKNWLTVITGLKQPIASAGPHPTGSAVATTGADVESKSAVLKSIDQIVAGINKGGSFASLELGVTNATPNGAENTLKAISHRGVNAPNYPQFDPQALFTRIFGGAATTGTTTTTLDQAAKINQAKKSILDTALADGDEVNKLLGAKDKARLADHLAAIRQIESRLVTTTTTTTTTTVKVPTSPKTLGVSIDTKSEAPMAVNDVMADMLAVAFASDVTRNASLVFTLPAAHVFYRSLGTDMNDDFHDTICHTDAGTNATQTRVDRGVIYAMKALAVFLEKLAALPEGAGTVLDNSLVYVTSCTSWGKTHDTSEWPVLLAGKAGASFKGNQHLRYQGQILTKVLLSIANAFGANLTTIGKGAAAATGELTGLRIA